MEELFKRFPNVITVRPEGLFRLGVFVDEFFELS